MKLLLAIRFKDCHQNQIADLLERFTKLPVLTLALCPNINLEQLHLTIHLLI